MESLGKFKFKFKNRRIRGADYLDDVHWSSQQDRVLNDAFALAAAELKQAVINQPACNNRSSRFSSPSFQQLQVSLWNANV